MLGWVNLGRNKVRLGLIRLSKEDLVLVMLISWVLKGKVRLCLVKSCYNVC